MLNTSNRVVRLKMQSKLLPPDDDQHNARMIDYTEWSHVPPNWEMYLEFILVSSILHALNIHKDVYVWCLDLQGAHCKGGGYTALRWLVVMNLKPTSHSCQGVGHCCFVFLSSSIGMSAATSNNTLQVPSIEIQSASQQDNDMSTPTPNSTSNASSNASTTATPTITTASTTTATPSPAPRQTTNRPRTFSLSSLVGKTRRAYSVSSAYPPKMIHPSLVPSNLKANTTTSNQLTVDKDIWFHAKHVTPTQRRHSVAAAQRKYEDFQQKMEEAPLYVLVSTYLNYLVLILLGHLRDVLGKVFKRKEYAHLRNNQVNRGNPHDISSMYIYIYSSMTLVGLCSIGLWFRFLLHSPDVYADSVNIPMQ